VRVEKNQKIMDWLNLHTSVLDSPEVIGAEPIERATWLMLMRYCIGQENSGRIIGAKTWGDRKWQQIVRVTLSETQATTQLWGWDGEDLVVTHYPLEKEKIVKGARVGGQAKTQAKTQASRTNGQGGGRPKTQAITQGKTQQKGREGKGNGMEGKRAALHEAIRQAYPRRTHVRETLTEIEKACRRAEDPDEVLNGTVAVARAVEGWTENERLQFLKIPPAFFAGDHWRDDPAFWASKTAARKEHNGKPTMRPLDLGGRKPAAILQLEP